MLAVSGRRAPPLSLKLRTNSSTDYESIPSIETTNLDGRNSRIPLGELKLASNHSSHDYESIDHTHLLNIDADSPVSPPYIPDGAARNKFLKIDSEGYASVLYPHEEDDSWEFDCLNQDKDINENQSNGNSGVTVQNVEEAWKHQLEKGYAPLTVRKQLPSPPVFSRTSSAPPCAPPTSSPLPSAPEPRDYEVPLHIIGAPLPPPVALRRSSLMKQLAISLTPGCEQEKHLGNTEGSESVKLGMSHDSAMREALAEAHSPRPTIRSRVMTAPAITLQSLAEQISS